MNGHWINHQSIFNGVAMSKFYVKALANWALKEGPHMKMDSCNNNAPWPGLIKAPTKSALQTHMKIKGNYAQQVD